MSFFGAICVLPFVFVEFLCCEQNQCSRVSTKLPLIFWNRGARIYTSIMCHHLIEAYSYFPIFLTFSKTCSKLPLIFWHRGARIYTSIINSVSRWMNLSNYKSLKLNWSLSNLVLVAFLLALFHILYHITQEKQNIRNKF
jgi:phage-related protein